ncbi:DEAD-box type RNA helicase, partial [Teratosphaeriaceae sp. CCFEE 6253]
MSSLIPLKYGCVKCILVGDPKQLPPTVFSKEAARFQYEQSLFVRMQNNAPAEVHLLDTQYRMHPAISAFPSRTFYDGLLKDGKDMEALRRKPWHRSVLLAPYRFFDVQGQQHAAPKGHSLVNVAEVGVAIGLYERLTADYGDAVEDIGRVGVITPYKSQLRLLRDRFTQRFGAGIAEHVEFNTTDAFQGRESEIIIFSCVRASPGGGGGIGFLNDVRRMNVGLTRAKSSLWVLGNSESLMRGPFWRKLVEDAKARDKWTGGNVLALLARPSREFPVADGTAGIAAGRAAEPVRTIDPRRPSEGTASTSGTDPRRPAAAATSATSRSAPHPDKMEGVQYRFEDRLSRKRPASPETAEEDVDMEDAPAATDAESITSGTGGAAPSLDGARSRGETPLPNASGTEDRQRDRVNGAVKPRMAPSAVPQG